MEFEINLANIQLQPLPQLAATVDLSKETDALRKQDIINVCS